MAKPDKKKCKLQKIQEKKIGFFCDRRGPGLPRAKKRAIYGLFDEMAQLMRRPALSLAGAAPNEGRGFRGGSTAPAVTAISAAARGAALELFVRSKSDTKLKPA